MNQKLIAYNIAYLQL